jgi:catechol 2,3-dioxygenase-like lactoylglutathione lyase family enzyme
MIAVERIEFLSAVLLTSRQPDRLAAFYRDVLGLPLHEERHDSEPSHWGCELGDVHFAIHPAEDAAADDARGPGPIHLAFWVFDLESFVRRLENFHGVRCRYPIQDLGSSSLVTAITDPDGNEVELTQMGRSWVEHLAEHRREGADVVRRASAREDGTG